MRTIADRTGTSKTALIRHKEHLPPTLAKAQEAAEAAHAGTLLEQVRDLQGRAFSILGRAEKAGDLRTALGAIREARGNLELLARLLGELQEAPVNVLILPEWITMRAALLTALDPFPVARLAVAQALEGSHANR